MIHILTHEYPPQKGGAGIYCRELALAATIISRKVTVWAPSGSVKDNRINLIELPFSCSQSYFSSWNLIRKFKKFHFENGNKQVLHLAEPASTRAFVRFGFLISKEKRFILTIHGSELLRFTRNPLEKWLFKNLLLRCNRIHVLSRFNEKRLIGLYPFTKQIVKRISGAPAGSVIAKDQRTIRKNDRSTIRIACVGRIHPRKGQDQILLALLCLPEDMQKQLVINYAGPNIDQRYLKKVHELAKKFLGKVLFHGPCNDQELTTIYAQADIFALTSRPQPKSVEGFGFVYLEASSHGLPIVANRIGGVEDAVIHEETGLLSHPHDLHTLSENFKRLISDQSLREKLGKNGISWANSHSWDKIARDLYSDL
jgi:phosphatidylinositol alpha-1,6-mannosyltransferase